MPELWRILLTLATFAICPFCPLLWTICFVLELHLTAEDKSTFCKEYTLNLSYKIWILLLGLQLTHVQRYWCSTVNMVLSYKCFTLLKIRLIHVWHSRTSDGVRCAHYPIVITTIMDQKQQLLKPLNKRIVAIYVRF
jgi:hypothetical protein